MTEAPCAIKLLQKQRILQLTFESVLYELPCAYLRAFSPAADGKAKMPQDLDVNIIAIEPCGQYAVKLIFSDGHATGIFSWELLHRLAQQQGQNWPKS